MTGNTPVLDIIQPLVIGVDPVFRHEFDFAAGYAFQRLCGNALALGSRFAHRDEPLVGEHGFDHHAGAVAAWYLEFVLINLVENTGSFQVFNNFLARVETVHALILPGRMFVYFCIQRQYADRLKLVALSHCVVVEIMRGGDLHHASAELLVHIVVGDDGNFAIAQRQFYFLADKMFVTLVLRMHHYGHVAQHGFRAGGGDGEVARTIRERVMDVPHKAVFFFLHHFQVGHRGVQFWIPVHQALAAIDQALVVEAHKGFGDGFI